MKYSNVTDIYLREGPLQKKFAKTTKKQTLKLKCKKCGFVIQKKGMRLRKLTIGGA